MDKTLHHLLLSATATLNRNLFRKLSGTGLTSGQPKVLDFLSLHNGCEQKDIASACEIESSTVTSLLSRMEESGLVERKTRNGNRRSLSVSLTEKGGTLQETVAEAFTELESQAFQGFSELERTEFLEKLLLVYRNLSAAPDSHTNGNNTEEETEHGD